MGDLVGRAAIRTLLALLPIVSACAAGSSNKASEPDGNVGGQDAQPTLISISANPVGPTLGQSVRLTARVTGYLVSMFNWVVNAPDQQVVEPAAVAGDDGRRGEVSFTAELPGTYSVHCEATLANGARVSTQIGVQVTNPNVPSRRYRVRVTPTTESSLASKELYISLAGEDLSEQHITIDDTPAQQVQVRWAGNLFDTQLRIFSLGDDPAPRDEFLRGGVATIRLPTTFRALFIPLQPVAPSLPLRVDSLGQLGAPWRVEADAGVTVSGSIALSDGSPVSGASVSISIRSHDLLASSTVGVSDVNGKFTVLARTSGEPALFVVAPSPQTGLPVATLDVPVPATGVTGCKFTYGAVDVAVLTARLNRAGGGIPAAGASVVFSRSDQAEVGTLVFKGDSYKAKGIYRYTLISDAAGTLHETASGSAKLRLPAGTYQAEIRPGQGEAQDQGYRSTEVTAEGNPSAPLELSLGRRVILKGAVVTPLTAAAGEVQITASAAPDRSFVGAADSSGNFSLTVDDKSSYALVARAVGPMGRRIASSPAAQVAVDGDTMLTELRLPKAVLYSGSVSTTSGGLTVGRALIRIWCDDPSCPNQELVEETQSWPDGTFLARIPMGSVP